MGYSEKFWASAETLSEAEAAALANEAFAAAGFAQAAPAQSDLYPQTSGTIALPVANPDAGVIYPEHIAIFAIWLACVGAAAMHFF